MITPTVTLVFAAIAANTLASILLKNATAYFPDGVISPLSAKGLLIGGFALACYAAAFVFYAMLLRVLPVSKAYMLITFGAQAILLLVGAIFVGERYEPEAWFGIFMVFIGLVLVARSSVT